MTEKEAWIYIADAIEKGENTGCFFWWAIVNKLNSCLCFSVSSLYDLGEISWNTANSMSSKIPDRYIWKNGKNSSMMAPQTKEGSLVRLEFCRKIIKELETKEKKC